jgi:hypothetical protein
VGSVKSTRVFTITGSSQKGRKGAGETAGP